MLHFFQLLPQINRLSFCFIYFIKGIFLDEAFYPQGIKIRVTGLIHTLKRPLPYANIIADKCLFASVLKYRRLSKGFRNGTRQS
jgi:hypothetical protein